MAVYAEKTITVNILKEKFKDISYALQDYGELREVNNMEQYNIFGEVIETKEAPKTTRRFKTMQELYGLKENESCKTCSHLVKFGYHNKVYYKCELWRISQSASTDIRLRSKACSKWKAAE